MTSGAAKGLARRLRKLQRDARLRDDASQFAPGAMVRYRHGNKLERGTVLEHGVMGGSVLIQTTRHPEGLLVMYYELETLQPA